VESYPLSYGLGNWGLFSDILTRMEVGKKMAKKMLLPQVTTGEKKHNKVLILPCKYYSMLELLQEMNGEIIPILCQESTGSSNATTLLHVFPKVSLQHL
jgi:hypothetical protein